MTPVGDGQHRFGADLAHLHRRLERAIAGRKTIQLSATELDILTAIGVYEKIALASAAQLKIAALARLADLYGEQVSIRDDE